MCPVSRAAAHVSCRWISGLDRNVAARGAGSPWLSRRAGSGRRRRAGRCSWVPRPGRRRRSAGEADGAWPGEREAVVARAVGEPLGPQGGQDEPSGGAAVRPADRGGVEVRGQQTAGPEPACGAGESREPVADVVEAVHAGDQVVRGGGLPVRHRCRDQLHGGRQGRRCQGPTRSTPVSRAVAGRRPAASRRASPSPLHRSSQRGSGCAPAGGRPGRSRARGRSCWRRSDPARGSWCCWRRRRCARAGGRAADRARSSDHSRRRSACSPSGLRRL